MMRRRLLAAVALAVLAGCEDPPAPSAPQLAVQPSPTAPESMSPSSTVAPPSSSSPTASPALSATLPSPSPSPSATPQAASPTPRPSVSPASPSPTPSPSPSPGRVAATGLLVPLYLREGDPGWARLAALKRAHPAVPVAAILNPADGVTSAVVPAIAEAVKALDAAGVVTLGYVKTGYAVRSENAIYQDLDRWHSQYPLVKGVFFDEMVSDEGAFPYYGALAYGAKRRGFTQTVGNVGVTPQQGLFAAMDVVVVYEDAGLPADAPTADHARVAMLAHTIGALDEAAVKAAAKRYAYLYVTEDALPNPWDTLSRYAETLADLVDE